MNKILSYVAVALLAGICTFWYAKSFVQQPATADPIDTYMVAEIFKMKAKTLLDSVSLKDSIQKNILSYLFWDKELSKTFQLLTNNKQKAPCPPPAPPNCERTIPVPLSICVACACCLPDKSDYTDPTPYKPFRIAAPEDWDTRLYSNNKELTVNAYVSNGLKIFALPNHERFDAISVKVNGQVSTVQLPSLNR